MISLLSQSINAVFMLPAKRARAFQRLQQPHQGNGTTTTAATVKQQHAPSGSSQHSSTVADASTVMARVCVTVNKARHDLELAPNATFADLQAEVYARAAIAAVNQKIFLRGKRLDKGVSPEQLLRSLPAFATAFAGDSDSAAAAAAAVVKLKVIGSTDGDLAALRAAVATTEQQLRVSWCGCFEVCVGW